MEGSGREGSERPRVATLPLAVFVVAALAEVGAVALSWGREPWPNTAIYAVQSAGMAFAGMLVASKHPRNAVGWLMLWLGVSNALLADLAQGYGLAAIGRGWPGGEFGEWLNTGSVVTQMVPSFALWLVFPTGRLLSRRWLGPLVGGTIASVVAVTGYAFSHRADGEFAGGVNPYVIDRLPDAALWAVGNVLLLVSIAGCAAAVFVRLRRSTGIERQQVKWFALAMFLAVLVLPLGPFLWNAYPVVRVLVALVILAQPVAIGIAMFRYRLFDIDRIISRTISYGLVTVVLVAVYGLTVVALGAFAGRPSNWVTAGATLAAAAAFWPIRRRAQVLVDRRFDRTRFEALTGIDRFIDELRVGRVVPEQIEALLREVTGDPELAIHHGRHGEDGTRHLTGFPVRRGDAVVATVHGAAVSSERRSLVEEVVAAAGLAIEIAGLRVELRHQLDEVAASRARLVTLADQERRRLERDLHDGAQQRLVSIGLALRHAQHQLRGDAVAEASRTIDAAVDEIGIAVEELRELAHGLRPSSLDAGLGPALRDLAQRAPLPVSVDTTAERFDPEAETTAYFVACEALTNAVKHACASRVSLRADEHDGTLVVRVADDGIGGARPLGGLGLRGLADRLAARGGTLAVSSDRSGTTITASIPCGS